MSAMAERSVPSSLQGMGLNYSGDQFLTTARRTKQFGQHISSCLSHEPLPLTYLAPSRSPQTVPFGTSVFTLVVHGLRIVFTAGHLLN